MDFKNIIAKEYVIKVTQKVLDGLGSVKAPQQRTKKGIGNEIIDELAA